MLAVAGVSALAAVPALAADRLGAVLGAAGAASLALLVLALATRVAVLAAWSLALLGAELVALLYAGGDGRLFPAAGAGLVLVAELAHWALEPPSAESPWRRGADAAAAALAGGAAATVIASIGSEHVVGGLVVEIGGVAAAVLAGAVVVALARTSG